MDKSYAWFAIYNFDCKPDEISEKLGIKSTETWLKGDNKPFGKGKIRIRENIWKLKSTVDVKEPIEKQLQELINILRPVKDIVKSFSKKYYTEFGCAIYLNDYNSGVHLDKVIITEITDLGAELDFDIYSLVNK